LKDLVAYITTGFEDNSFTKDLILSLKENGVDKVELGIPFSDPVADGPVIEKANLIALNKGFKLQSLFDLSAQISKDIDTFWMGYFNTFYHKGFETIAQIAANSGVKGFIIPDLPHEESLAYAETFTKNALANICFVAPTDSDARIGQIVKDAKGFIYLVAYTGITGSGEAKPLDETIAQIKSYSNTPLYVGFGVNEKTAKERAKGVDGVIVGSAFVQVLLDEHLTLTQKIANISNQAKTIKALINE